MPTEHDGITMPLGPDAPRLALAGALFAAGVCLAIAVHPVFWASTIATLPMVYNNVTGRRRVRITVSKLLIEDERPVRNFLIGPRKQRFPWDNIASAEVADGGLRVSMKTGDPVVMAQGRPAEELEHLLKKVTRKIAE